MKNCFLEDVICNTIEDVLNFLSPLREAGKTIVTTNGCFDILHAGHIQYLREAASMGDIFIVALNSDKSVRKLKGDSRPLQNQQDRMEILAALKFVDCVFIFDEDDPCVFLESIRPDIHVKGGDYTEDIIEKPVVESHGGKIAIVSFKEGYSTSNIVKKIKKELSD